MDAEETGYGTRAVGRGVDTDAVLFRVVESVGCMCKAQGVCGTWVHEESTWVHYTWVYYTWVLGGGTWVHRVAHEGLLGAGS